MKIKNENFEKKNIKKEIEKYSKKLKNKKTLKKLKNGEKTRGFGQMVRLS